MSSELQALLVDPGIVWVGAVLPDADIEAILAEEGPAFDVLQKRTWEQFRQETNAELREIEQQLMKWHKACQEGRSSNLKLIHRYMHDDEAGPLLLLQLRLTAIWGDETVDTPNIPDVGKLLLTVNRQLKRAILLLDFRLNILRQLRFHRLALGNQHPWDKKDKSEGQDLSPKRKRNIHRERAEIAARLLDELEDIATLQDLADAFEAYGEDPVSADTLSKSLQSVRVNREPLYVPAKQGATIKQRKQALNRLKIQLKEYQRIINKLTTKNEPERIILFTLLHPFA